MKTTSILALAVVCACVALAQNSQAADKKKPAPATAASFSPVAKYDLNKNGILDPNEIALIEKDAELMKKYDKDGDGKISDSERAAMQDSLKTPPGLGTKKKK
jgi:hypothetical protein